MKILEFAAKESNVTKVTSKKFTWNLEDIGKGFLMAAIGAAISPILESLNAGSFKIDWKHVLAGAITAGMGYLIKNFFQPSQTIIKIQPPTKDEKKRIKQ